MKHEEDQDAAILRRAQELEQEYIKCVQNLSPDDQVLVCVDSTHSLSPSPPLHSTILSVLVSISYIVSLSKAAYKHQNY